MKNFFTILNFFLIAIIAYYIVATGYKKLISENETVTDQKIYNIDKNSKAKKTDRPRIDKNITNIIVKRNLFNVEIERDFETKTNIEESEPLNIEPTKLKLILWGTVTGKEHVYAVIEDKKIRKQALYQIDDEVQGAKLKKILRNKVILTFQGKDQLLEIQTNIKDTLKRRTLMENTKMESVMDNLDVGHDISLPDNIGSMMRQIKFRPHFSKGEADGLMVYGIRPNSVFQRVGLRNGDIIKDINGTSIMSQDDFAPLFTNSDLEDALKLTLIRRGKIKELSYPSFLKEDEKGEK